MAIVVIWNNNVVTTGHSYMGHAAMSITGNFADRKEYVSWWPGASSDKGYSGKEKKAEKGHDFHDGGRTFLDDLEDERGYTPDHVIFLPDMNVKKMQSRWNEIRYKSGSHYRAYYKNCSTIVARVLRAGSTKGSSWQRHSHIWTPLKVKRLAHGMGGGDMSWNFFVTRYLDGKGGITKEDGIALKTLKKRTARHGCYPEPARFVGGVDSGKGSPIYIQGQKIGGLSSGAPLTT